MCVCVCVCVCVCSCLRVCVVPVCDGESALAGKSLGTGYGGRTLRKLRCVERS